MTAIDLNSPGGQAGTSSKIENYLGFPTGISGQDLAQRAMTQAVKFPGRKRLVDRSDPSLGTDGRLAAPQHVNALEPTR